MQHELTQVDIQIADAMLLRFCSKFEVLFGTNHVTPNMHLHGHIKECITDYGPLRSFCLFAFERYNGLLGSQPTNNMNIEPPQLMRKFIRESEIGTVFLPQEYTSYLSHLLPHVGVKDGLLRLAAKPMPDSLDATDLNILQNLFSKLSRMSIIQIQPFVPPSRSILSSL